MTFETDMIRPGAGGLVAVWQCCGSFTPHCNAIVLW